MFHKLFDKLHEAYDPITDKTRIVEASLPMTTSHDALRGHLHRALKTEHGVPADSWSADSPWVSDIFPTHVVYHYKGETLKRPYTVTQGAAGSNPTIKLGASKKVHTAYVDSKTEEAQVVSLGVESVIITLPTDESEVVRESVGFDETVKVTESAMTTIPVKLIGPGWGSMAYYSKEVLKRDGPKVFTKGTHMMWNHATSSQEAERPEGDLNDLAAVLTKNAEWKESGPKGPGLYSEAKVFSDYATKVAEKGAHIGVSINAGIRGHEGSAEGRTGRIADAFVHAFSTDFVTKAGAGGAPIVPVTESQRAHPQGETVMDEKDQAAMAKENATLKEQLAAEQVKTRAMEAGQHEIVAFATVAAVLKEAEIPFKDSLLKRACANPTIKEGKPDPEWVKAVVADFSDGQTGRVMGLGSHVEEGAKKSTGAVDKRLREALTDLGVPKSGLDYAVSGRA